MSIYYAFFDDDRELAKQIGPARQLPGAEVAFSYSHGAPGVEGVLVVIAAEDPNLEGVTFQKIAEVPVPSEDEVPAILTDETTTPETTESADDESAEGPGQEPGGEPHEEGPDEGAESTETTA